MKITCKQCGKEFELTQSEIDFYESKNLHIPKRCEKCRAANKASKCGINYVDEKQAATTPVKRQYSRGPSKLSVIAVVAVMAIILVFEITSNNSNPSGKSPNNYVTSESTIILPKGKDSSKAAQETDNTDSAPDVAQNTPKSDDSRITEQPDSAVDSHTEAEQTITSFYTFKNADLLDEHYRKHGIEMGFVSAAAYEAAAAAVVLNPTSLHKLEAEDGDDVYYLESTNEFVIVSTRGFIRTYFKPDNGMVYYNSQ